MIAHAVGWILLFVLVTALLWLVTHAHPDRTDPYHLNDDHPEDRP